MTVGPHEDADPAREVHLVGDGISGQWMTWRWSSGWGCGVAQISECADAYEALDDSLPSSTATHLRQLRFTGALANDDLESDLMMRLGKALLPDELRQQILSSYRDSGLVNLRVAPSPVAAQIPWGLLHVDRERRLLDVANISWIAPFTPRDLLPPEPAVDAEQFSPLYVIDPRPNESEASVMSVTDHERWREQLKDLDAGCVSVYEEITRDGLRRRLTEPRSRLILIGHCHAAGQAAGDTGFQLSEGTTLTAAELVHNQIQRADHSDTRRSWTMPQRAAIVACASGTDQRDHEPFGLPTAMMVGGARTVMATLWPLPTDHAYMLAAAGSNFTRLAMAIDRSLQDRDPIKAINAWQRTMLNAWRETPCLDTAPLTWASVAAIHAPDRYLPSGVGIEPS